MNAAVEVLEEQADHLEDDEIEALRVLSNLRIDGMETFSGQPMGSVMSFPLLCVIEPDAVSNDNVKALKANPYTVLHDEGDGQCRLGERLRARAKKLLKWYEELGMPRLAKDIPQRIK